MSYLDYLKEDFEKLIDSLQIDEICKHYMRSRWLDQILWMEKKAQSCKVRHYRLRVAAIVGSTLVPILVSLQGDAHPLKYLAIGLGGIVAIATSIDQFFKWGDRWHHYRKTSESLKAQGWQLSQSTSQVEAFNTFIVEVESILAKDVELFTTQVAVTKENQES